MKFSNLTRRLKDFSDKKEISLEDVLGMMTMLCDDIRFDTGDLVENCQVGDLDLLIDRLYTICYTVNYIYQGNSKKIAEAEMGGGDEELWNDLEAAEKRCGELKEKNRQLKEIKEKLKTARENEEKELEAILDKLQGNN